MPTEIEISDDELAKMLETMSPTEIARHYNVNKRLISNEAKRLKKEGYNIKIGSQGRKTGTVVPSRTPFLKILYDELYEKYGDV